MRYLAYAAGFLAICNAPSAFAQTSPAAPQPHTFVSALHGNDANIASSCSQTAPCLSLDVAESMTTDRGVVTMLDAGDYGRMSISQNVTIEGQGPQTRILTYGSSVGGAAIYNNIPGSDVVLRNFSIVGTPGNGSVGGVYFVLGRSLVMENVTVNYDEAVAIGLFVQENFTATLRNVHARSRTSSAFSISPIQSGATLRISLEESSAANSQQGIGVGGSGSVQLSLSNTTISNSTSHGIRWAPTGATTKLSILDSTISNNAASGILIAPSGTAKANVTISHSAIDGNDIGVSATPSGSGAVTLSVADTSASSNRGGIYAIGKTNAGVIRATVSGNSSFGIGAAAPATVRIGSSLVTGNAVGLTGPVSSYGNNQLLGNTTQGSSSPVGLQSVP